MSTDTTLRKNLVELLRGGSAHLRFDDAVEGLPPDRLGEQPEVLPYSPWQLVEHMRIAQHDILDFCRNPNYVELDWPDDYWPAAAPSPEAWAGSLAAFREDLRAMIELVQNPEIDLQDQIPHGEGQTYAREAMLVADHNAYHLGQLVTVRRLLGLWPAP